MSAPEALWKTEIVIWTDFDPESMDLSELGREAESGDGFCSSISYTHVTDKDQFPDTEFFDGSEED